GTDALRRTLVQPEADAAGCDLEPPAVLHLQKLRAHARVEERVQHRRLSAEVERRVERGIADLQLACPEHLLLERRANVLRLELQAEEALGAADLDAGLGLLLVRRLVDAHSERAGLS